MAAISNPESVLTSGARTDFQVTSEVFALGKTIPPKYTGEGEDRSPPLTWGGVPEGTRAFAVIVSDPDAPAGTWHHWVLYNIPASATGLPQGVSPEQLPPGTQQAFSDFGRTGYGGPCPPIGRHRYFHKLYALDVVLADLANPRKQDMEKAMKGHILEQAVLIGTYQKGR